MIKFTPFEDELMFKDGIYNVAITNIATTQNKWNPEIPQLDVTLTTTSKPYRTLHGYIDLEGKYNWVLKQFLLACNEHNALELGELDPDKLINRRLLVEIENQQGKNDPSKRFLKIKKYIHADTKVDCLDPDLEMSSNHTNAFVDDDLPF